MRDRGGGEREGEMRGEGRRFKMITILNKGLQLLLVEVVVRVVPDCYLL